MPKTALDGNPLQLGGMFPIAGDKAVAFSLVDADLQDKTLADYSGKTRILNIVPSLDTPVCQVSTRKFNEYINTMPGCIVLVISADLPFAMKRFCTDASVQNVIPLSTMRGREFLHDYGVEILDGPLAGISARAVVVIDKDDMVIYSELVNDIKNEPDYEKVKEVVQKTQSNQQ